MKTTTRAAILAALTIAAATTQAQTFRPWTPPQLGGPQPIYAPNPAPMPMPQPAPMPTQTQCRPAPFGGFNCTTY